MRKIQKWDYAGKEEETKRKNKEPKINT